MTSQAVILAAGYGQRLRARSPSKPLTQIAGITLLEISIRQLMAAGIEHITVVTGHEADMVEAQLHDITARFDINLKSARLNDWSKPNGWSVIAGAQNISDSFILVMADHIFGDGLLTKLAQQKLDDCDVILATDAADNPLLDPDDATWVKHGEGRKIHQIGKEIAPFDVVDCGAFLASPPLVSAIETAIANAKPGSLSNGMQVLADAGRAKTMDVGGSWWLDVDDPRSLDLAQEQAPNHIAFLAKAAQSDG